MTHSEDVCWQALAAGGGLGKKPADRLRLLHSERWAVRVSAILDPVVLAAYAARPAKRPPKRGPPPLPPAATAHAPPPATPRTNCPEATSRTRTGEASAARPPQSPPPPGMER